MKTIGLVLGACLIAGCGADTLGTAATVGAARSKEIQNAQQTQEQVRQKLDAAMQTAEQVRRDAEQHAAQ